MSTTAPSTGQLRAWLGLAVLALPTIVLAMDVTVLYLALPELSADLGPDSTEILWIMDSYGLLVAGLLITMGTLGDRIGRRKLLLIGATAFTGASVLAAFAPTTELLILARALLGIAGATLMPSTLALISTMFPAPRQRATAFAVWTSCFSVGLAIGPLVGGALLATFWWGSVFLLAVPVMVLLLVSGPFLLPEARDEDAGRLDLPSAALSLAAILPIVYGVKELAKAGPDPLPIAALLTGLGFGVLFIRRQRKLTDPLLDLRLFHNRSFTVTLGGFVLSLLAIGGTYLFVTQYLQLVAGLSPLEAGLWLVPVSLLHVLSSLAGPRLAGRFRATRVVALSQGLAAAGYLVLVFAEPVAGVLVVIIGMSVVYLGNGPVIALGTDLIVGAAPPKKAGSAASISEMSMELGIAFGVAVLGSVGGAVYQARIAESLPAGTARDNLPETVAMGSELPAGALDAAREAFVGGLTVVAGISAVILTVVAVAMLKVVDPKQHSNRTPVREGMQ